MPLTQELPPDVCRAEFCCKAPGAKEVALVGSFNNWDGRANPMTRRSDGTWNLVLSLPPGFYHYKFVVDGQWRCNPEMQADVCNLCAASPSCVPNHFGTFDRVMIVA